jgi:hypothetical protein
LRRALAALRQSHPGIVIDGAYDEFEAKNDVEPPWLGKNCDQDLHAYVRQ